MMRNSCRRIISVVVAVVIIIVIVVVIVTVTVDDVAGIGGCYIDQIGDACMI